MPSAAAPARREVATRADASRSERLAALERALATVERGLELQPDEWRLLVLRGCVGLGGLSCFYHAVGRPKCSSRAAAARHRHRRSRGRSAVQMRLPR